MAVDLPQIGDIMNIVKVAKKVAADYMEQLAELDVEGSGTYPLGKQSEEQDQDPAEEIRDEEIS